MIAERKLLTVTCGRVAGLSQGPSKAMGPLGSLAHAQNRISKHSFCSFSTGWQQGRSGDRDSFSQFEKGQEYKSPLWPALGLQHAPILTLTWNGFYRASVTSPLESASEVTPVTPSMSSAGAVANHHQDSG